MGPDSEHSGTGCFLNPLCAQAPMFPRHSADLELRSAVVPGYVDALVSFSQPMSLTCSCPNDALGAVGQTAFLSWSTQALANLSAKEALSILMVNFPTRLCKDSVLFSQSCWLPF